MKNIEIIIKCTRSPLEAIVESIIIAKAFEEKIGLDFGKFTIWVHPSSNTHDLFEIYNLNLKQL